MITIDLKRIAIQPGDRILDIGCGSGRHVSALAPYRDITVHGCDLSLDEVLNTRSRLKHDRRLGTPYHGRCELSVASATSLPFGSNFFDLVICSEVLEHIPEHAAAIRESVRVLKPGKTLAVSVPRFFPEWICKALSREYFNTDQGHIRIYKKRGLIDRLEATGVDVQSVHHAHGIHTPYWWLKCLLGLNRDDLTLVNLYHRFLVWDIMKKPMFTQVLSRFIDPLMGKSLVIYGQKERRHVP